MKNTWIKKLTQRKFVKENFLKENIWLKKVILNLEVKCIN